MLHQLLKLLLMPLTFILRLRQLKAFILFLVRKSLLYTLFEVVAIAILLAYYFKFIPTMEQRVNIHYHLLNGRYYGFVIDPRFKSLCDSDQDVIRIPFQATQLKFERNILCNSVLFETQNEVSFQNEYYQIWYSVHAKTMVPQVNPVLEIHSYQVSNEPVKNFKQSNHLKLGDNYFFVQALREHYANKGGVQALLQNCRVFGPERLVCEDWRTLAFHAHPKPEKQPNGANNRNSALIVLSHHNLLSFGAGV